MIVGGYVFINGDGLVQFKVKERHELKDGQVQYTGMIKYPKNVYTENFKKWVEYDYYFDANMIFKTPGEAANHVLKSQPKRG